jgi:hypothetical protein
MSSNVSKPNFDLNYLADNQPSMCIPRVFENISERQVREVFEQLDLGQLDHIDIIERKSEKGENYKRIFIHFSKWYWNDEACTARRRLIEGKDIKVVYNMPWFWKISANRWSNNNNNQIRESNAIHEDIRRNVRRGGPRIEFEDEVRRDDRRDDRRSNDRHNEVRRDDTRNDRRNDTKNDTRNDRRNDRRNDTRNDRYNEVKSNEVKSNEVKRNDKQTEVFIPVIKEEPTQSAAEIAQLAIINSTKKRKIILKKKEPQPKVELVVVEEVKEENA